MLRNLKVFLGRPVSAADIKVDQTSCQRAFADGFHIESARDIVSFIDHTGDGILLTPSEIM